MEIDGSNQTIVTRKKYLLKELREFDTYVRISGQKNDTIVFEIYVARLERLIMDSSKDEEKGSSTK